MKIFFLMIPVSLLIAIGFIYSFLRAVKTGQYDDLDSPPIRAILDDVKINQNKDKFKNEKGEKKS